MEEYPLKTEQIVWMGAVTSVIVFTCTWIIWTQTQHVTIRNLYIHIGRGICVDVSNADMSV